MALKTAWLFFGSIVIALQFFHVSCAEVGDFYMNVTDDTSRNLSIECSRTIKVAKDFLCSFQLSNGTFITYKSVIGNKEENVTGPVRYGIIHPSSDVSKKVCKIKVYPPFNDLRWRKAWKCWIITVNQTFGTIVKKQLKEVQPVPSNLPQVNITSNAVHVKRGDNFLIGCQVMEPIVNCSFHSPHGINFTVLNETRRIITHEEYKSNRGKNEISRNPIRTLEYNSSFSMGDCFAIVSKADQIHAGQWTCKAQLNNTKTEVSKNFTVAVNDSYLVASSTEEKSPKKISCTAIPGLSSKIVECEWKFPNNISVSENNFPNITRSKNNTSCDLTFKGNNNSKKSYGGKWICNAKFKNDFGNEYNDTASITYSLSTTQNSATTRKPQLENEDEDENESEEKKKKKKEEKDKKKKDDKNKKEKEEKDQKKKDDKDKKEKEEKDKKKNEKTNKKSKSASTLSSSPTWIFTSLLSIFSVLHYVYTSR